MAPSELEALSDGFQSQLAGVYPTSKRESLFATEFTLGNDGTASTSGAGTPVGYRYLSADRLWMLQVRLDGFAISRLAPYSNWGELRNQASRLWPIYSKAVLLGNGRGNGPGNITRVACRYINRIDLPLGGWDYKDYFRTSPEVSPALPQGLSDIFMRLGIPLDDARAIVIMATAPQLFPDKQSVILDLDVFRTDPGCTSNDEVWALLDALRSHKNNLLEGCITDNTRQLFGEKRDYE